MGVNMKLETAKEKAKLLLIKNQPGMKEDHREVAAEAIDLLSWALDTIEAKSKDIDELTSALASGDKNIVIKSR